MSFLKDYDKYKKDKTGVIPIWKEDAFHFYSNVVIDNLCGKNKIMIVKKNNLKALICNPETNIKVHFSDYDIINLMIKFYSEKKSYYDYLVVELKKILDDDGEIFNFSIGKFIYKDRYYGIRFVEEDFIFNCKADFNVSFNEFLTIINLVLAKEFDSNKGIEAMKATICKYICIARLYTIGCSKSKILLESEHYNTEMLLTDNFSMITLSGEKRFLVNYDLYKSEFM